MQKLLIEDDEGKSVVVPLIRDEITIGRQEGNTIRLSEQNVSRRHARLARKGGVLLLEDLASYNGIKLNGAVLSAPAPLKDGDIFLIGDYRMAIKEERASAAMGISPAAHVASASALPVAPAAAGNADIRDAIEAQPTIPLQSATDVVTMPEPAPSPARLAIIGKFMEGREFILDRPSLVIGRTAENDIVIEHKSISRHHARIVREGNQYFAVDLESANGVRVNGVDHDRVILRAGDEIELGQVRLRFVAHDGAGAFETGRGLSKGKLYAIAGGAVGILAVVLVVSLSGGRSRRAVPPPPPPPPTVAQPVPQPPPPPPAPKETLAELLAAVKSAQEGEKWDEALAAANKAIAAYSDSSEAAEMRKLAEEEKGNANRFATLKQAAEASNFEVVLRGAGEIPAGSVYKERATELENSARPAYIKLHIDEASGKAKTGDCDVAKQEAELVLAVDGANKTARWIIGRCAVLAKKSSLKAVEGKKPAPATRPVTAAPAARTVAAAPAARPAPPPQPEVSADPEKLIQQAREAWLRGQFAVAIDAARKALRAKPGLSSAYQIIAICSCSLHDSDTALRAYEKLDEGNKKLVRSACQKNGITF